MDFTAFSSPSHPAVNAYAKAINAAAIDANVPPCALAAIVLVESGGQNILQKGMPPGPGCGVGLCQITSGVNWQDKANPLYYAGNQSYQLLDPESNLFVAARFFLAPAIRECIHLRYLHPTAFNTWSPEVIYFTFAAYNAGFGEVEDSVLHQHDPDAWTTNEYAHRALDAYHAFLKESRHAT